MAKYEITHTCGHGETVQIYGTNTHGERERSAEWQASRLCRDCYRAQQTAQAAADAAAQSLPALQGSEKQIAWALTIRAKALADAQQAIDRQQAIILRRAGVESVAGLDAGQRAAWDRGVALLQSGLAALRAQTDSRFWIDRRGLVDDEWMREAGQLVRAAATA